MNYIKKSIYGLVALGLAAPMFTSCVNEDPFGEGEGVLKMKMVINSTITRDAEEEARLADGCIVYVSSDKGLIYKFQGVSDIPGDLYLKSGHYVAEAWAGDSVSASFEHKFYKAYQPFDITRGDVKNVVLNCKIANVVASVIADDNVKENVSDYKMTIGHTRATLDFSEANHGEQGFFMMPDGEKDLLWTLTGTKPDGSPLTLTGKVEDVQPAHEYRLNLIYNEGEAEAIGGSIITVTIDDQVTFVDEEIQLDAAPNIIGVGYDINDTMVKEANTFEDLTIYVQSWNNFKYISMDVTGWQAMGLPVSKFNFSDMNEEELREVAAAGITCNINEGDGEKQSANARINISESLLNKLPEGRYAFAVTATDAKGKTRVRTLNINISSALVETVATPSTEVFYNRATLYGRILKDEASNPYFRYKAASDLEWKTVTAVPVTSAPAKGVRKVAGQTFMALISDLKPDTEYVYQVGCDGYLNEAQSVITTDRGIFEIPNGGFENWNQASDKAVIPSSSSSVEWWDSGNHGSITMSKNVTNSATSPVHGGQYSACLQSQFVGLGGFIGKFAAGNIYAGTYDKTDGTDGELTFGRPFNGSRPLKLRGYAYYKPGTVEYTDDASICAKGTQDTGIVYIGLTTRSVKIKTKTKELFSPSGDYVVAYGEMVFTGEYGSSSEMKEFEITLNYVPGKDPRSANTIVLTGSASRYGDYFAGGNSVLYLDDLELVY